MEIEIVQLDRWYWRFKVLYTDIYVIYMTYVHEWLWGYKS